MTRLRILSIVLITLFVAGCAGARFSSDYASGYYAASPKQCVIYAREISGIKRYGDAHTWWKQTPPDARGNVPVPGAVLVLAQTGKLRHGHLAVVQRVIDRDEIDVAHSNWGSDRRDRCRIYETARVVDVSPYNDWTQLRFWNARTDALGFPYAAYGFVYR